MLVKIKINIFKKKINSKIKIYLILPHPVKIKNFEFNERSKICMINLLNIPQLKFINVSTHLQEQAQRHK